MYNCKDGTNSTHHVRVRVKTEAQLPLEAVLWERYPLDEDGFLAPQSRSSLAIATEIRSPGRPLDTQFSMLTPLNREMPICH